MACFWETFVKKINRFQVSRIRDVVTFRPFKNKDVVTVYTCVSCDHQIFTYGKWFYHASHVSLALHFFFKYVSDFKWISYNIDSITGQSATSNEPQPTQKKTDSESSLTTNVLFSTTAFLYCEINYLKFYLNDSLFSEPVTQRL